MLHHYIKSFFSSVKKNRFFYSINLIGFLIGFMLLSVIFTFVYQEFSFDKFNKNADNIYRINSGGYGVTPMCFGEKLKNQLPEISHIVRFNRIDLALVHKDQTFKIDNCYLTDQDVFEMFSFNLLSGNKNKVLDAPFSIVLDQSTAKRIFGDHSPVGETIEDTNGRICTITGVMEDTPANSHIHAGAFVSMETLRHTGDESSFNCGSWCILTYISLSDHANSKETEQKINTLLEDSRMGSHEGKIPLHLEPLKKIYFDYAGNKYDGSMHGNLQTVIMYLAISILILIIVIINYINLSTAISGNRVREFAIRKVNGARQVQIVKQIVLEALGIIFISYAIALVFIEILLPQFSKLLNLNIYESGNRLSLYLLFLLVIIVVGLITGLVPGLFLSKMNETKALKNEQVFKSRGIQRRILLILQLIIVATLLNSVFIVKKQIGYVLNKNLGFSSENVVYEQLDKTLSEKSDILKNNLLRNPDVKAISFSDNLMGDGCTKKPIRFNETEELCYFYSVDPDYIDLYKIKLKYGRNFSWDMPTDFERSCLVNEEFCKAFGIENPVNKTFAGLTIIGVVNDYNYISLHQKIEPLVLACVKRGNVVQAKIASNNRHTTTSFIKYSCENLSPSSDREFSFLDTRLRQLYQSELDLKRSFEIYAVVTFLIALLGLFGLTLFMIRKKTKESGIRKLYGATVNNTFMLFAREQIIIVLFANIFSFPISYWAMSRWLSNFQYRTSIGITVFLATLLITLVFTLLAISWLIWKTHNQNLAKTLKYE